MQVHERSLAKPCHPLCLSGMFHVSLHHSSKCVTLYLGTEASLKGGVQLCKVRGPKLNSW